MSKTSLKPGTKVYTIKGSRVTGAFSGTVTNVSDGYVMVRKSNGRVVRCLQDNIRPGSMAKKGGKKPAPKKPKGE